MPPTSDTLDRFHQVLLQEISDSRPEYLTKPFTVAEIYQNLVPYRSHRDRIGVEMNGDYEDILLRLLAGEGDYLVLDSEVARREIREELESPNPNTGLFRDFAATDVRLNLNRTLAGAGETGGEPATEGLEENEGVLPVEVAAEGSELVVDIAELRPDEDDREAEGGDDAEMGAPGGDGVIGHIDLADVGSLAPDPPAEEPGELREPVAAADPEESEDAEQTEETEEPEEPEESEPHVESGQSGPSACQWCRQELPSRELLNFCPFCGSDMRLRGYSLKSTDPKI